MDKRTLMSAVIFVIGLVFLASFSIQHDRFFSGICGIIGCFGIVAGFIGLHWEKIQNGDRRLKRTIRLLLVLCLILIILNIIAKLLG
ncbi:hypothetical protein [uncultured Limosilactobacillus sp.]|uniref:hypothetical protein n=1 Tax=uncultured Limosilactobacillus sp. TaxID=2837629 RepID=UPI0025FF1021|nr:hypothetical protein [uncultured Limosilactobacillus sp.]